MWCQLKSFLPLIFSHNSHALKMASKRLNLIGVHHKNSPIDGSGGVACFQSRLIYGRVCRSFFFSINLKHFKIWIIFSFCCKLNRLSWNVPFFPVICLPIRGILTHLLIHIWSKWLRKKSHLLERFKFKRLHKTLSSARDEWAASCFFFFWTKYKINET